MSRDFRVRGLGEVAIRCADLAAMVAFYRDVIGLRPLTDGERGGIVFFEIGPGHGGHTTVLALFRYDAGDPRLQPTGSAPPATGAGSSLHHLALTVGAEEQAGVLAWYEEIGQPYRVEEFPWIGWRGIFTEDPEGNTVELVAKIGDGSEA
ncbi:MAG: VOC family protein [Pseudomonadota bacterium]